MPDDPDVQEVLEGERRLHDATVRSSRARAGALLDPEFHEFGASGTIWDRASVLEMMSEQGDTEPPVADRFVVARLAGDVIHLTYRVRRPERTTLRSSLWRRREGGAWQMYFHQATVLPSTSG